MTSKPTASAMYCPECYVPMPGAAVIEEATDRYGRRIRRYFGWCINCDRGFEVVSFRNNVGLWLVHRHRYYAAAGADRPVPSAEWRQTFPLPEPAAVVVGPGGEYDERIDLNEPIF